MEVCQFSASATCSYQLMIKVKFSARRLAYAREFNTNNFFCILLAPRSWFGVNDLPTSEVTHGPWVQRYAPVANSLPQATKEVATAPQ